MLFEGQGFPYNPGNQIVQIGEMFGFISNKKEQAVISNRIFETWFYNLFISEEALQSKSYKAAAEIKNQRRTDIVVDYFGEQYIIEMKIWHGSERHRKGEEQLAGYLESYHKEEGYLISFNFNKSKRRGSETTECMGKTIFEVEV
jgi:hypothetical protein